MLPDVGLGNGRNYYSFCPLSACSHWCLSAFQSASLLPATTAIALATALL